MLWIYSLSIENYSMKNFQILCFIQGRQTSGDQRPFHL